MAASLRRALPALAAALALALAALPAAPADDGPPFPPGMSTAELEGLRCSLVMPPSWDPGKERSMVVILHGNGGTETGMAGGLVALAEDDFVVVAPRSRGVGWEKREDLEAVKRLALDLRRRLRIGPGRLHVAGFSNGGWNLPFLAFDEDLHCASACILAAGYNGGSVPKWARREMGILALVGADDGNRDNAEAIPKQLGEKVRSVEVRVQPGRGHEWPDAHIPYYRWWLGVQEGRFTPGATLAFDWAADAAAARAAMEERKVGGFAYWYGKGDGGDAEAKSLQNEVLQDPLVRRFGSQLVAWKRERGEGEEEFRAAGLERTPAVVVVDAHGKVVKSLEGRIGAGSLANALRAVAADRSLPKR